MIVGYVLSGFVFGLGAFVTMLVSGHSIWLALAAYPLAGMVGMLLPMLLLLCGPRRVNAVAPVS